jgi:hypothetical protein
MMGGAPEPAGGNGGAHHAMQDMADGGGAE